MFFVFINEKEKTKQLKVPKSPRLFYCPHPTNKKSTRKEQKTRETKSGARSWRGVISPVQNTHRVTNRKRLIFARKRVERNMRGKGDK